MPGTSKSDFEALADTRITEARALLDRACYDGAFYLGGYAVECALKAIIAKTIPAQTFPAQKKDVDDWFVHDLEKLLRTSGLAAELEKNHDVLERWTVIVKWKETKRYERGLDEDSAKDFCDAIDDAKHGVLTWLKQYW